MPSELYRALGSEARIRILQEVARRDRTPADLAESLDLHPVTIRYHLQILLKDRLIEQRPAPPDGGVGRPGFRYRIRRGALPSSLPPNLFEMLSEILLQTLTKRLSRAEWSQALRSAGLNRGQQLMERVKREAGVAGWEPRLFARLFVKGSLSQLGLDSEVVTETDDVVRYRLFSCPFREFSTKFTDEICDHLDVGFYEGVRRSLGPGVTQERLACMGHGDPYCEYVVRWGREPRKGVP